MANTHDNPVLTPADGKRKQLPARDEREQKLRKLRRQIKDGTYKVDADAVAEKIMHEHFTADAEDKH